MNILKNIFNTNKTKETLFIKKFNYNKQISDLEKIIKIINNKTIKKNIEKDIFLLKKGYKGEQKIAFQINNLFTNAICLHDIRLEYKKEYIAQCDFILITNKAIYVLESKDLNGDILINSDGDFIRHIKNRNGNIIKKEGMYSPISQNIKHIKILKKILEENKITCTVPMESVILLTNDKSIINKTYAPSYIKKQVIKYDQLNFFIQNDLKNKTDIIGLNDKNMKNIAIFLNKKNKQITFNYVEKYKINNKDIKYTQEDINNLKNKLKKYRLKKSKKNKIQPYCIFNNKTLDELSKFPIDSISELSNISNFGKKRCTKYGNDILQIFKDNKNKLIKDIEENTQENFNNIKNELKKYRLKKSKENKIQPYCIFNNKTLDELSKSSINSISELSNVSGFGEKRCIEYGNDILQILNKK